MAWDRGERGYREDRFSRGRAPARDNHDDDRDERDYYRGSDYDDEEERYGRAPEQRHWRGSEYDSPSRHGRGRNEDRYSADAERLLDRRHRHGFLRGESQGRIERDRDQGYSDPSGRGSRESVGDQDRWTGPYAGRGPKNYRRSDERILEDVCERLMEHPSIDPSDVEVSVDDGDVTLTGTVENRAIKHLSEAMAETVTGVKEVHNQLRLAARASGSAAALPDEAVYRQRR